MKEPIRKILWSAENQQASNSTITLNDSIDNYDEIIYYGSGTKNDRTPCVATEYPVIPGVLNLGGPFFVGKWASADSDNWILCNGTQVFLSGNSGYVASSFYMGKNNGSTAWAASLLTNRTNDVRPYRIVGVKYKNDSDRSLIWSSTEVNLYNQNIALSETINHFDKIIVYGSGYENTNVGCYKASKNSYVVQPNKLMNVGTWCYTPWKYAEKHNLLIGNEMLITGNSGHINSGFYWGMGNQSTTYVAAKVTADISSFAMPYAIIGVGRHPSYRFIDETTEGGSVSSNINPGYSGDIATITVTPESEVWKMSALNITGAELTGNDFMFNNSNISAQAEFEHSKNLTLENGDHGILSADKMSGFSGDVVTVDATTDEGWYLSAIALTGAEATGFKFMFTGSDVTALGEYTDVGFPITYESTEGGSLEGDPVFIPGSTGVTLNSVYDTYYRLSGYEVTGGTITDGVLVADGPCTAKAVYKVNYFTATGNFEKGSNESVNGWAAAAPPKYEYRIGYKNIAEKYAVHTNHTGDISTSWYATSNRWNPSNASAYSMTINSKMTITASAKQTAPSVATAVTIIGTSQSNSQSWSTNSRAATWNYNKTITTTNQGTYGVSARIGAGRYKNADGIESITSAIYLANGTNGTWTATGIAP